MLSEQSFNFDSFANNANAIVNNVKFSADGINSLPTPFKCDTIVQRVFDIFVLKLTPSLPYRKEMPDNDFKKYQQISITLKEYMNYCNIKNNKTRAIEQLRTALSLIIGAINIANVNFEVLDYIFLKWSSIDDTSCSVCCAAPVINVTLIHLYKSAPISIHHYN